ncbi:SymE family type I addiction module toxin [Flavivirga aquimarina]|uniref:SymE family type I addiction module toxin n=1 Tax=Flavivirga aquimarina TaxID=2027862 RepID=A0ABT8W931_9FLAO|nr:SymE family type I addiction module toxin [Flavivirga aquimarina]MDO5969564.1 SymE family type I addiction module toxin [Flavivirga aquimarina]
MNQFRVLKIYSKFRYRRWGSNYTVPEIRIEGKWLEQLGFEKGNEILIEQKKKKLIITVRKEKRA